MAPIAHVGAHRRAGLIELHRKIPRDEVRGGGETDRTSADDRDG